MVIGTAYSNEKIIINWGEKVEANKKMALKEIILVEFVIVMNNKITLDWIRMGWSLILVSWSWKAKVWRVTAIVKFPQTLTEDQTDQRFKMIDTLIWTFYLRTPIKCLVIAGFKLDLDLGLSNDLFLVLDRSLGLHRSFEQVELKSQMLVYSSIGYSETS